LREAKRQPKGVAAVLAAAVLIVVSDGAAGGEGQYMTQVDESLLAGQWQKDTEEGCASRYPPRLTVRGGGIYEAPDGPEMGSLWHGGDWRAEEDALFIQAANDAMLSYRIIKLDRDQLVLADSAGCRVVYRRAD